jgi:hypothetical protein
VRTLTGLRRVHRVLGSTLRGAYDIVKDPTDEGDTSSTQKIVGATAIGSKTTFPTEVSIREGPRVSEWLMAPGSAGGRPRPSVVSLPSQRRARRRPLCVSIGV